MTQSQALILAAVPPHGRFLSLGLRAGAEPVRMLERLQDLDLDDSLVLGLGAPLLSLLGGAVAGLRTFPALSGPGISLPSTQGAMWLFIGGNDPGAILQRARAALAQLGPDYRLDEDVASFTYRSNRDLTGYEDGTENPKDEAAPSTAILQGAGVGLDGSSFVATQRWIHDLATFESFSAHERDHVMGRRLENNEEIADAPPSAHVKRAAQESYEPAAFMLRRSMPWGNVAEHGLYFVAYGASLDPFERVLTRMLGLEDGIPDALLRFSRAVSGGYYWCPPLLDGRLDLRAITGCD